MRKNGRPCGIRALCCPMIQKPGTMARTYSSVPFCFGIPGAEDALVTELEEVMHHIVGWLPEYGKVVGWLTDNQGKGLFPFIFRLSLRKVFSRFHATELCDEVNYRHALRQRFIVIDDFDIERTFNDYGNLTWLFLKSLTASSGGYFACSQYQSGDGGNQG